MSRSRYQLIEALPYPKAPSRGHLTDTSGAPLHGVYERKIQHGYRAAIVNHGKVLHRYDYRASLTGQPVGKTRRFSNLVHTIGFWQVGDDAERPVTKYPRNEFPLAARRPLWNEPVILDSLINGIKHVGILAGTLAETDAWAMYAQQHGLIAKVGGNWPLWDGQTQRRLLVARAGRLAHDRALDELGREYAIQVPGFRTGAALARLASMTGEDLDWAALASPRSAADLVVSGYCFGYPVATTVACILGTHG